MTPTNAPVLQKARASVSPADDPRHRAARYLSILGHPFIVIPASVAAVAILRGGDARSALIVAALFVALSVAIVAGIRAGRFNDFDVSERQRRPGFYAVVTLATLALGLWRRDDPQEYSTYMIAGATLAACGIINRWTKASLHTAFSLYAAGLWGVWSLTAGLVALPVAASVAWSRVHLRRHSLTEVVAGALVGLAAGLCLLLSASLGG